MTNIVDPDQMLHSAASYLGLDCLLGSVCPITYGKSGRLCSLYFILNRMRYMNRHFKLFFLLVPRR